MKGLGDIGFLCLCRLAAKESWKKSDAGYGTRDYAWDYALPTFVYICVLKWMDLENPFSFHIVSVRSSVMVNTVLVTWFLQLCMTNSFCDHVLWICQNGCIHEHTSNIFICMQCMCIICISTSQFRFRDGAQTRHSRKQLTLQTDMRLVWSLDENSALIDTWKMRSNFWQTHHSSTH